MGVDIGCGISSYPISEHIREKNYKNLEKEIRHCIPMGNCIRYEFINNVKTQVQHHKHEFCIMEDEDWDWLLAECNVQLDKLKSAINNSKENEKSIFYNCRDFLPNLPNKIDKVWVLNMIDKIIIGIEKINFAMAMVLKMSQSCPNQFRT